MVVREVPQAVAHHDTKAWLLRTDKHPVIAQADAETSGYYRDEGNQRHTKQCVE